MAVSNMHQEVWDRLIWHLRHFILVSTPINEFDIEMRLRDYLETGGFLVNEQKRSSLGRQDLVVISGKERFCMELKMNADASCFEQLDRYSRDADGLILMCWKASKKVKKIFELAKKSAKIPIDLIEIRNQCKMV